MLLKISDLTKKYGDLIAVNQLSLDIHKGEIYGLLGPNGSGKTTLIRTIIGMLKPDGGTATLFEEFGPEAMEAREKIGYMPQAASVYKGLSVWENIFFFGKLYDLKHKEIKRKGEELLHILDLEPKKNELVSNLSGGMVRRLLLATTLIHSPSLILLDEPTAGVDPVLRLQFWEYFEKLATEGTGIIITTHHISEAVRCHKVGFMRAGKIFKEDTPRGLMDHYGVSDLEDAFVISAQRAHLGEE